MTTHLFSSSKGAVASERSNRSSITQAVDPFRTVKWIVARNAYC